MIAPLAECAAQNNAEAQPDYRAGSRVIVAMMMPMAPMSGFSRPWQGQSGDRYGQRRSKNWFSRHDPSLSKPVKPSGHRR
jgi:hypothetical protein